MSTRGDSDQDGPVALVALGAAGAAGALAFLATLVSLHLLDPGIRVVADYVSDYANGPYGGLFATSVVVHGAGNLAMAAGLWRALGDTRAARQGAVLLGLAAVGLVAGGVFPTDPPESPATWVGVVHRTAASTSFAVELLALVVLVPAFRDRPLWRGHALLTRVLSIPAGLALAWLVVAIAKGWPPGLPERLALAIFLAWELWTGLRLSVSRPTDSNRLRARPGRCSA